MDLPNFEPCGAELHTLYNLETHELAQTLKDLPIRNSRIQLINLSVTSYLDNLNCNILCEIFSKGFEKSTVIMSTQLPLSPSSVISSNNSNKLKILYVFCLNPCWAAVCKLREEN